MARESQSSRRLPYQIAVASTMPLSVQALAFLDRIEAIEMRSLEWGFTDGSLSEDEAYALGDTVVVDAPAGWADGQDLVEELIEARLVFEMPDMGGVVRIRSRFGEMMRLLAANRQLFPNRPWQGAPSLVADFRVDRRPRRFPRRDRAPSVILQDNPDIIGTSPLRRDLWQSLTARSSLRFSAFQERAAVRLSSATDDGGTIVTAGTGSGKTIAFYLPGMIRIGEAIDASYWVKAIAIYPRIELLKDQFAEAFRMARVIDAPLRAHGRRSLMIGALFGATPRRASRQELNDRNWQRRGQDFVCPWMRCPSCDGELFWRGTDIDSGTEQLVCAEPGCQGHVSEDQIVLTRGRLQRIPQTFCSRRPKFSTSAYRTNGCVACSAWGCQRGGSQCSRCSTRFTPMRARPGRRPHSRCDAGVICSLRRSVGSDCRRRLEMLPAFLPI
ncbi:DEAD/DEAH box helicase [Mesorhizobium sp. M0977]